MLIASVWAWGVKYASLGHGLSNDVLQRPSFILHLRSSSHLTNQRSNLEGNRAAFIISQEWRCHCERRGTNNNLSNAKDSKQPNYSGSHSRPVPCPYLHSHLELGTQCYGWRPITIAVEFTIPEALSNVQRRPNDRWVSVVLCASNKIIRKQLGPFKRKKLCLLFSPAVISQTIIWINLSSNYFPNKWLILCLLTSYLMFYTFTACLKMAP